MKLAFIFPGQGSQYVGMGKEMLENFTVARHVFEEANDTLGFDLQKMCFEGPEEELKMTANTQPALLTVSVANLLVLKEQGFEPSVVAGHSLGEYSALVAAGAFSFADAVSVVRKRGGFMQECAAGNGGMAAVLGLDKALVAKACQEALDIGDVEVANYNCPGQIVIAGEKDALQKAMENAKSFGAKRVIPLQVSGPFHTSLMKNAAVKLAGVLETVKINKPVCPVISNVTADIEESPSEIKQLLEKQVYSSVRWDESIKRIEEMNINAFIEVGPGKVLTGLMKKINKEAKLFNVEDLPSLENTLDKLREV